LAQREPTSDVTWTPLSRSKVKDQLAGGGGILWQPPAQLVIFMIHHTIML